MTQRILTLAKTDTYSQTNIENPRLRLVVRVGWFCFIFIHLLIFAFGIPYFLSNNNTRFDMSQSWFFVMIDILTIGGFLLLGSVIVVRRSDNWMALYTVWAMLFFGLLNSAIYTLFLRSDKRMLLFSILSAFLMYVFLLIFPDGRFRPRWAVVFVIAFSIWDLNTRSGTNDGNSLLVNVVDLLFIMILLIICMYRYRVYFSPARKQQTKWVITGTAMAVIAIQIRTILLSYLQLNAPADVYQLIVIASYPISHIVLFLVPVSVMFAALRYRLWDIDFVIERSLVFGLSFLIAVGFIVLDFWIGQTFIIPSLGQEQANIALVIGVGVAGLLFNPIRKIVEQFIDKRLYGLRYDIKAVARAGEKPDIKNPGTFTGQFCGAYELLGVIGKGGMGEVYKGFGNDKVVAVKVLPQELAKDPNLVKRFEREAEMLSRLNHPHIVKLYDSGITDTGAYYLVMEFIDGIELGDYLKEHHVDYETVSEWSAKIGSALDYIHQQGLVHRDVKPSNIMLRLDTDNQTWQPILMDFGIAHLDYAGTQLTGTGAIGTIDYMAPEQIMAAKAVDYRADIYSLGVVLYEMVTGERLYKGSPGQILFAHLQQPPIDPRDLRPDVPRKLAHAILRALSKKPEDRFQSAGELAQALI